MPISIEVVPMISALLVCFMAIYLLRINRAVARSEANMAHLIDSLAAEVLAISHGSMGVGRRVLVLEKQVEQLLATIEEMQKNDPAKVSYAEAARLVELGAGVEDLMNSCGISRPEAELVSALTESKKGKIPTLTEAH